MLINPYVIYSLILSLLSTLLIILKEILRFLLEEHRSPLILSDRFEHLSTLLSRVILKSSVLLYFLKGDLGKKERSLILSEMREHYFNENPFSLFATGSLSLTFFFLIRCSFPCLSLLRKAQ